MKNKNKHRKLLGAFSAAMLQYQFCKKDNPTKQEARMNPLETNQKCLRIWSWIEMSICVYWLVQDCTTGRIGEVILVCRTVSQCPILDTHWWKPPYWVFNIPTTHCEIQKWSLCLDLDGEVLNSLPHPKERITCWEVSTHVTHSLFQQKHSMPLRQLSTDWIVSAVPYPNTANINTQTDCFSFLFSTVPSSK